LETKFCGSCQQTKGLTEFNKKKNGYQSKCRDCSKAWYKNYYDTYDRERTRLVAKNAAIRLELRDRVKALKSQPCMDCGESYPYYVMDFDHQYDKKFNIGYAVSKNFPISRILEEIVKCDVVCSNCHRIRTHSHRDDPL
jgi:hypothetical protein